jgi:hypothetical protein
MENKVVVARTRTAEFMGGLGDVLHNMHHTTKYTVIDTLSPGETYRVVLRSHNPFVRELFLWHPKYAQLDIKDVGFVEPWGPEERKKRGIDEPWEHRLRPIDPLTFHPSPNDFRQIERLMAGGPYIAFCLSAGSPERNVPVETARAIADIAVAHRIKVAVFGRTYTPKVCYNGNYHEVPRHEVVVGARPGVVDMIDALTIPGTAAALRGAAGVVCAHSAMCMLAWFMRKPTFLLYPQTTADQLLPLGPFGYMFGRDFPDTWHGRFADFAPRKFSDWLELKVLSK